MTRFDATIIGVYVLGAVMSAAFLFTWLPLALRALVKRRAHITALDVADYAGLHLIVLLAFALILRNIYVYGVTPLPSEDHLAIAARLALPIGLNLFVGLRLFVWIRHLWRSGQDIDTIPPKDQP
jgi:hypothetical protein